MLLVEYTLLHYLCFTGVIGCFFVRWRWHLPQYFVFNEVFLSMRLCTLGQVIVRGQLVNGGRFSPSTSDMHVSDHKERTKLQRQTVEGNVPREIH